jgi:hypothetical protein
MVWLILIFILCIILSFLFFAPIQLKINSNTGQYLLNWGWILQGRLIPDIEEITKSKIQFNIFFFPFDFYPLKKKRNKQMGKDEKKDIPGKQKKDKKRIPFKHPIRRMWNLLRSFQVKVFDVNIDTDDYVANAYLFPAFQLLSRGKRHLQVNFEGKVEMQIWIQNNGIRVLRAFFR